MEATIRPFGPKYQKAIKNRADDTYGTCCYCGRLHKGSNAKLFVLVVNGGDTFAAPETGEDGEPGWMGFYPIGPVCAKKLPKGWALTMQDLGWDED